MSIKKSFKFLLLLCAFLLTISTINAQFLSKEWRAKQKEKKERKMAEGKWMVMPLIGPSYTPELKFTLAGGIMTSFKTNRQDSLIQRSSMPIMFGVSTTGAYFFGTKLNSYWLKDKIWITGDFNFKSLPDNYWGVGYDAGRYTEKSDSTTAYHRTWFQINPQILWHFRKHFFLGANIDLNYTKGSDPSAGVAADPYYIEYNDLPFNSGLGAILQYDSRDVPVNSWKGTLLYLSATFYGTYFGGDNDYQVYMADLRQYWTIKRPGSTLTCQAKARFGFGNIPYGEMSQPGTPFDLRGYVWGRYRAPSMALGIVEYRYMFLKKSGKISPHGVVMWVGAGTLGNAVKYFDDIMPNFGVGYRLQVQPRMNLRLDFGIGTVTYGFYFNFNEAF
ncbi:MAG TPA: BamA/TamA family outer membrane protein [Bacteroidales bacterium]